MTTLRISGLSAGYRGVPVVHDIDLAVEAGKVLALLGANGAGKTTLIHTIAGVIPPVAGEVFLDGKKMTSPLHRRARQGVALVTEERAIIRRLTTRENLKLGTRRPDVAIELFPVLGPLLDRKAGLLSGGEQQMLVLGRILANDAKLLLVDELSFGLAPIIVRQLLGALRRAADRGTAVVVVEQHPQMALQIADDGVVLSSGRVAMSGSAASLMDRLDEIERAYLSTLPDTELTGLASDSPA